MVRFYDNIDDSVLKFAVIIAEYQDRQVWCKHKERDTYEIPGGHREAGERIDDTARRELMEETGAVEFEIEPVCVYSVTAPDNFDGQETFDKLYHAVITELSEELHSEIERIELFDSVPEKLTYPDIQPRLTEEWMKRKVQEIYTVCPTIENKQYLLRLVRQEDAADLLSVYSDKSALPFFNSDNCHGEFFYYRNINEMNSAIQYWLKAYRMKAFVRFAIIDKNIDKVIGTVELFHRLAEDSFNHVGLLRLDLGYINENSSLIFEILSVIVPPSFRFFDCETIITKAPLYAVDRIEALRQYGFKKSEEYLVGHIDHYAYKDYWVIRR